MALGVIFRFEPFFLFRGGVVGVVGFNLSTGGADGAGARNQDAGGFE